VKVNTKVLEHVGAINASNNSSQVSHQGAHGGLFIREFKGNHYNVRNAPVQPLHPNTLQSRGHYSPLTFTNISVPNQS
jgi:hypothetical protein